MSYLRYLCVFADSGIQHILSCVFPRLEYPQFLWIFHFGLPLRHSLTFIHNNQNKCLVGLNVSICLLSDLSIPSYIQKQRYNVHHLQLFLLNIICFTVALWLLFYLRLEQ